MSVPPLLFWVRQFLLFGLVSCGGALRGEGFTLAFSCAVAPVGIELALLFEHGCLSVVIVRSTENSPRTPVDTEPIGGCPCGEWGLASGGHNSFVSRILC